MVAVPRGHQPGRGPLLLGVLILAAVLAVVVVLVVLNSGGGTSASVDNDVDSGAQTGSSDPIQTGNAQVSVVPTNTSVPTATPVPPTPTLTPVPLLSKAELVKQAEEIDEGIQTFVNTVPNVTAVDRANVSQYWQDTKSRLEHPDPARVLSTIDVFANGLTVIIKVACQSATDTVSANIFLGSKTWLYHWVDRLAADKIETDGELKKRALSLTTLKIPAGCKNPLLTS